MQRFDFLNRAKTEACLFGYKLLTFGGAVPVSDDEFEFTNGGLHHARKFTEDAER